MHCDFAVALCNCVLLAAFDVDVFWLSDSGVACGHGSVLRVRMARCGCEWVCASGAGFFVGHPPTILKLLNLVAPLLLHLPLLLSVLLLLLLLLLLVLLLV